MAVGLEAPAIGQGFSRGIRERCFVGVPLAPNHGFADGAEIVGKGLRLCYCPESVTLPRLIFIE